MDDYFCNIPRNLQKRAKRIKFKKSLNADTVGSELEKGVITIEAETSTLHSVSSPANGHKIDFSHSTSLRHLLGFSPKKLLAKIVSDKKINTIDIQRSNVCCDNTVESFYNRLSCKILSDISLDEEPGEKIVETIYVSNVKTNLERGTR